MRYMVGSVTVLADKHGPYRFMRGGVEVDSVCDDGLVICAYHARDTYDQAVWELLLALPDGRPSYTEDGLSHCCKADFKLAGQGSLSLARRMPRSAFQHDRFCELRGMVLAAMGCIVGTMTRDTQRDVLPDI